MTKSDFPCLTTWVINQDKLNIVSTVDCLFSYYNINLLTKPVIVIARGTRLTAQQLYSIDFYAKNTLSFFL